LGSDVQQYCVPLYGCFEFLSHVKKDVQHLIFLRSHLAWVSKAKSLHRDVAMVARLPSHPTSSQQLTHSSSADRSRCLFYQGSHSTDSCRLYRVERQTSRFLLLRIKRRSPVRVGLGRHTCHPRRVCQLIIFCWDCLLSLILFTLGPGYWDRTTIQILGDWYLLLLLHVFMP
jgi:hypothetical protein